MPGISGSESELHRGELRSQRWRREEMELKEEFRSASDEAGGGGVVSSGAGRTECTFLCFFFFFPFVRRFWGEGEGAPD